MFKEIIYNIEKFPNNWHLKTSTYNYIPILLYLKTDGVNDYDQEEKTKILIKFGSSCITCKIKSGSYSIYEFTFGFFQHRKLKKITKAMAQKRKSKDQKETWEKENKVLLDAKQVFKDLGFENTNQIRKELEDHPSQAVLYLNSKNHDIKEYANQLIRNREDAKNT